MMKKFLLLIFFIGVGIDSNLEAQILSAGTLGQLTSSADFIQSKNYYLLTLLAQDKEVSALLKKDGELSRFTQQKLKSISASLKDCKDAGCLIEKIKFSQIEIDAISSRLLQLCKPGNALERLIMTKLAPSGTYILLKETNPSQLLVKAWEQDAAGINYAIGIYAEGKKPRYPLIDSISFNIKDAGYYKKMYDCSVMLEQKVKNTGLFFEPAMQAALLYLKINGRTDPANYEPMATTVNKAAVASLRAIDWSKYPYSNILVPGAGGGTITAPLSARGMMRCQLAAKLYGNGAAPFIMVSGGKVHPYKTTICEAEEMKAYLVTTLGIPERAVIMDPHARHTTTNLRNCARLIYRYGLPADKVGVIVTDKAQADDIMKMAARCEKELKYVPYKLGARKSETELEYYPTIESLQINPYEPLDP